MVVEDRSPGVTEDDLVAHLRGRLAGVETPRQVLFDELPKTSTGKRRSSSSGGASKLRRTLPSDEARSCQTRCHGRRVGSRSLHVEQMVFLPLTWLKASRHVMRRHQRLPDAGPRTAMWRLLAGEVVWASRQVRSSPWVALGLAGGFGGTLAVLGSAAPGPALGWQWRVVVAVAAAWVVAVAARGIETVSAGRHDRGRTGRPILGAAELCGVVVASILVVWLGVWGGQQMAALLLGRG